ncbi:hypothetical protein J4405_03245 [Candidatus Woesearchaeota archaeon]|nr:hypothetical protein [Candidatus Woesearchaeota archaeon]
MDLVIDANILFSILIKSGKTEDFKKELKKQSKIIIYSTEELVKITQT